MAVPPSTSRRKEKKCKIAFREVRRKLLLALETTNKQDRDVVCAEVFADITGRLNKRLQVGRRSLFAASLFAPNVTALLYLLSSFPPAPSPARTSSTSRAGTRPLRGTSTTMRRRRTRCSRFSSACGDRCVPRLVDDVDDDPFFFFALRRRVLILILILILTHARQQRRQRRQRRQRQQPFAAPIFSLLFHRWLLSKNKSRKHLSIMISGCRQLFQGDVDAGSTAFEPLHTYVFGWLPSRDNQPSSNDSPSGARPLTDGKPETETA